MSQEQAASAYHYTECAVAYLDVIGFKDRISKSSADEGIIKSIAEAFSQVQAWLTTFHGNAPHIQIQMFSDSVFVSCTDTGEPSLMTMITGIASLQSLLVPFRFHVTGCLTTGLVYQEGQMMFGPAMVEAYRTERLARWPRVIVAGSVLRRLRVYLPPTGGPPYFLCREDDGLTYIDYLPQGCLVGTAHLWSRQHSGKSLSTEPNSLLFSQLHYHRESILSSSSCDATVNFDVLPKCHALAAYHNKTIRRLQSALSTGPDSNPDLDYLQSTAEKMTQSPRDGASEGAGPFITEKVAALRATSGQLGQYLIDPCAAFPTLYGLPLNQ